MLFNNRGENSKEQRERREGRKEGRKEKKHISKETRGNVYACEKAKKNKRVDDYIIQEERQKSVYGESKTNKIRTILHTIGNKKKEKKNMHTMTL